MKRIIGLVLVVVMLVLSLASCAYNYAEDDMTKYSTFNKDAFVEALTKLQIEDGAFTTDEETRTLKVLDAIYTALAKVVDTTDKQTTGVIGEHDILYYNYYCTAVIDGVEHIFYASNMKESSALKFQLGLTTTEGVSKLIEDKVAGFDFTDKNYATIMTEKTAATDVVYVSYTYTYTKQVDGKDTVIEKDVTYEKIDLSSNHPLASKIVDKSFATKFDVEGTVNTVPHGYDQSVDVTYSDVTIHWAVKSAHELTFVDKTYTADTDKAKNIYGEEIKLKDVEITYHVFPTYYLAVAEINATNIVKEIFGKNITSTSLPLFEDEKFASFFKTDDDNKAIADLYQPITDAESAVETAQKTYDTAKAAAEKEGATETDKGSFELAKTTLETKKSELAAAEKALDDKIAALLAVELEAEEGKDPETVADRIVREYKESNYDSLEATYNNTITMNLAEAIWKLIQENVTVNSLPEKAVDEAYDALIDGYKTTFYTGTDSTTKKSHYSEYKGDFKAYLVAQLTVDSYDAAKAKVREKAEEQIKPIVQLYAVAAAYDLLYSNKEYKEYVKDVSDYYIELYGETNIRAAQQFNKLFDHFLEIDLSEDDEIVYNENGLIPYKNVSYSIKGDTAAEN